LFTANWLKFGQLTDPGRSVRLAVWVVHWHNFNLVGFGSVSRIVRRSAQKSVWLSSERRIACLGTPIKGAEMKHLPSTAELRAKLGSPSNETVEALRLLKAFLMLTPKQRFEVIEFVEQLATDPTPDGRLS
jgi:hypothetical protein